MIESLTLPSLEELRKKLKGDHPPHVISQSAFDYEKDHLERLVGKGNKDYDYYDLISYLLDVRYKPIQEDLFRYVFPLVLKSWEKYVLKDSEMGSFQEELFSFFSTTFHSLIFFHQQEVSCIEEFVRGVLLSRIRLENNLLDNKLTETSYKWIDCFILFGSAFSTVDKLWAEWWSFKDTGSYICAVKYISCLIYQNNSNPIYPIWVASHGGGAPLLWPTNTDIKWIDINIDFIKNTLDGNFLLNKLKETSSFLQFQSVVQKIVDDIANNQALIETKLKLFIELLCNYSDELEDKFFDMGIKGLCPE